MKQHRTVFCLALILLVGIQNQSLASITAKYNVFSTSVINNNVGAAHGLWISSDAPGLLGENGTAGNFFDILPGTMLTQFDNGTATLMGTAKNPYDDVATINLILSEFKDTVPSSEYKKEGGVSYGDATDHDFYSSISGTISFVVGAVTKTVEIDHMVSPFHFQIGTGANAKSKTEFGASAWIQEGSGSNFQAANHWDLNLTLEAVPEPTTFVVWSCLLMSACGIVRKKR